MKKIAFFDAHSYDMVSFNTWNESFGFDIHYYKERLTLDTVELAKGKDAVCVFVNDELTSDVIDKLVENGVKLIALRCAGFNNVDLNRAAHIQNSLSNRIIQCIEELGIDFVGDFHSTAYNSNPGFESVFSSKNPTPESVLIAQYISKTVGSEIIDYDMAGSLYKGAVEDTCNLRGIPAVTCEVLSPFASVGKGSFEKSLEQMKSFLEYFGF